MAGGGRINRQAAAERRIGGTRFFGHAVSCARKPAEASRRRAGEKVRPAGFMRPPFAIGPSSRSRAMGAAPAVYQEM